jgi:ATP-dependent Clp protease ATP-binding subunit ClpX
MKPSMTPSQIVKFLDQHVVGQEEAKRQLAVAVYTHYRKIELAAPERLEVIKSNVLLIGPTGTGKTLLCETLSRVLGVPFVTANATSLAQSEYVNDEIVAILERLIDKAEGDVAAPSAASSSSTRSTSSRSPKAQQGQLRGTSGEGVQHALLKIMEGAPVKLKESAYIDTTEILFICGGAFVGIESHPRRAPIPSASSRPRRTTTRSCSNASTPASSQPTCSNTA